MKTCKRCDIPKPLDEFYVHFAMADGHLNFCKECVKERIRQRRATVDLREDEKRRYERKKRTGRAQAQWAVNKAKNRGTLCPEPCEACGESRAQAHHDDYSRPLDVRWLCTTHHGIEHRIHAYR